MPIAKGQRGRPGALGVPGDRFLRTKPFRSARVASNPVITGVTRDSTGVALGACTVDCFKTLTDEFVTTTVSDGSGNFTLIPNTSGPFYLVAYLDGSPDVAGTTVNTLVAT